MCVVRLSLAVRCTAQGGSIPPAVRVAMMDRGSCLLALLSANDLAATLTQNGQWASGPGSIGPQGHSILTVHEGALAHAVAAASRRRPRSSAPQPAFQPPRPGRSRARESRQYALRDYLVICFPLAVPSLLPRRSWPPAVAFALHDSNKPRRRLSSTQ